MATGEGGNRLPVNCGVRLDGSKFVLSYDMGRNVDVKKIQWGWLQEGDNFVAKLEAPTTRGDTKYHRSAAIDSETHSKLGKAEKSDKLKEDKYFIVKLKKESSDVPDLKQFFSVSQ